MSRIYTLPWWTQFTIYCINSSLFTQIHIISRKKDTSLGLRLAIVYSHRSTFRLLCSSVCSPAIYLFTESEWMTEVSSCLVTRVHLLYLSALNVFSVLPALFRGRANVKFFLKTRLSFTKCQSYWTVCKVCVAKSRSFYRHKTADSAQQLSAPANSHTRQAPTASGLSIALPAIY